MKPKQILTRTPLHGIHFVSKWSVCLVCCINVKYTHVLRVVQSQGLEHLSEEPVLLTVLHRYLSSGDAMASPRIAAKAKSSIAAKPGGELLAE